MKALRVLVMVGIVCALAARRADAGMMLSLSAGATDLANLTVGQTVDLSVSLTGLDGRNLISLGGAVQIPEAHFSAPFDSVAGDIVPDPEDLLLQHFEDLMDGQFFALFGTNISTEGVFFSFRLTAAAAGSGVIGFDQFSLFAEDENFEIYLHPDLGSNELAYTIRGDGPEPIPEPATLTVWTGLMFLGGAGYRRRRRNLTGRV